MKNRINMDGFAYVVEDENGIPLDRKKKLFWSVTADTDQGLIVTEAELDFFEASAVGKKMLFRDRFLGLALRLC